MEQEEIWKDIEGYEGLYQVSNMGRVKSFDRIDSIGRRKKGRILSPGMDDKGYLRVGLWKEGKRKNFQVHRLVGKAFIPNPEGLPIINHKDENPKNNQADNLEWCDSKYNNNYGTRTERQVQTMIRKGIYDPELCDLDKKERQRLYYKKNQEQINERHRLYYQNNREQINERHRLYYQNNREQINERHREYNQKNNEKIREYQREYQREYYQKNREKKLEHQREYDRRRRDKIIA